MHGIGFESSPIPISKNIPVIISTLFLVYDALMEIKYGLDENSNFSSRSRTIHENCGHESNDSNTYRLLRVLRNAVIHNTNNISFDDTYLTYIGSKEKITITINSFYHLCSLARHTLEGEKKSYLWKIFENSLYKKVYSGVSDFHDRIGAVSAPHLYECTFDDFRRNCVINPSYSSKENFLEFQEYEPGQPYGYAIEYNDTLCCIPSEVLVNHKIQKSNIKNWAIDVKDFPQARHVIDTCIKQYPKAYPSLVKQQETGTAK
jgi:hypothetical protein